jgi:ATP-dependent DNA ligase
MPLARLRTPFDHADWIYELKLDGFRAVAYIESTSTPLVPGCERLQLFASLTNALAAALQGRSAILDGEIVHLGLELPLLDGKRLLQNLLPPQPSPLLYLDTCRWKAYGSSRPRVSRGLEGTVAKLASAPYTPQATDVGKLRKEAYTQAEGRDDFFDARSARASGHTRTSDHSFVQEFDSDFVYRFCTEHREVLAFSESCSP